MFLTWLKELASLTSSVRYGIIFALSFFCLKAFVLSQYCLWSFAKFSEVAYSSQSLVSPPSAAHQAFCLMPWSGAQWLFSCLVSDFPILFPEADDYFNAWQDSKHLLGLVHLISIIFNAGCFPVFQRKVNPVCLSLPLINSHMKILFYICLKKMFQLRNITSRMEQLPMDLKCLQLWFSLSGTTFAMYFEREPASYL